MKPAAHYEQMPDLARQIDARSYQMQQLKVKNHHVNILIKLILRFVGT